MDLHGCRKSIKTCIEMKLTKCGAVLTPGGAGEVEESRGRALSSIFLREHMERKKYSYVLP